MEQAQPFFNGARFPVVRVPPDCRCIIISSIQKALSRSCGKGSDDI